MKINFKNESIFLKILKDIIILISFFLLIQILVKIFYPLLNKNKDFQLILESKIFIFTYIYLLTNSLIVFIISSVFGTTAASNVGLYGIGTSFPASLFTGAFK